VREVVPSKLKELTIPYQKIDVDDIGILKMAVL
jgi:hypothetical protein